MEFVHLNGLVPCYMIKLDVQPESQFVEETHLSTLKKSAGERPHFVIKAQGVDF